MTLFIMKITSKMSRTMVGAVLIGSLVISPVGCSDRTDNSPKQLESKIQVSAPHNPKEISGKIINIDEDSLPIAIIGAGGGGSFNFENIRIEDTDGRIYNLIFPGPSNYVEGDQARFRYFVQQNISYSSLIRNHSFGGGVSYTILPIQKGFLEADGIISR